MVPSSMQASPLGFQHPVNAAIVDLVKHLEQGELVQLSPAELCKRLLACVNTTFAILLDSVVLFFALHDV